jgi:hypothetical protein
VRCADVSLYNIDANIDYAHMEIQALWKEPGFGENAHTSHTARKSGGERLCVIFENSWQFFSLGACQL